MNEICVDTISSCELLGRILNETSQINKQGRIKDKAMYPKLSAEGFVAKSDNVFRGFLFAPAFIIKQYDFKIVPDGNVKNPYHAHIIIPDLNVDYFDGPVMAADVIPTPIRKRLDRLRMQMRTVILNPGPRYPKILNHPSLSDSICNVCPTS